MFSKPRINDPIEPARPEPRPAAATQSPLPPVMSAGAEGPKAKPAPSSIASDLVITGNVQTTGDVVVDGKVDGDIRAQMLTVGESAVISGEIVADDVVIHGHIRGRVRGLKVRLTSTARVEGDIVHKTIAIESGAHFEGSVQRRDDPLGDARSAPTPINAPRPAPKAAEG
jgi:cytoskeletal protein CcmA (bactofilin family)